MRNVDTEIKRKNEIYEKLPRIKDIDRQIAASSLAAAKSRIKGTAVDKEALRLQKKQLAAEKTAILTSAGYPADYLSPICNCPICKDTGYVKGQMCSCLKQIMIDQLYRQSTIKDILSRENFDTFSLEYYSKEPDGTHTHTPYVNAGNILDRSKGYVKNFNNEKKSILIYGDTGLGKTFITNCIAKALLDEGHTVLYLSSINLFENILSEVIMNNGRDEDKRIIYDYIYNCELLIIDDLGTELASSFVQSQLFEIINTRNNKSLATVISTNLSMKQLQERYTERIMSRIVADYIVFNFYGDNIRYAKRRQLISSRSNN
jgi:DNA replication protein DnaC